MAFHNIDEPKLTLPEIFLQVATAHSSEIAIKTQTKNWTYAELNAAADQVAASIIIQCPDEERVIALFCRPDADSIAGALGILKAGRCYVGIDPSHPRAHQKHTVSQSGAGFVVCSQALTDLALDLGLQRVIQGESKNSSIGEVKIGPGSPAFIVFTSGSTGVAKGVVFSHRALVHHAINYSRALEISSSDCLTMLYTPAVIGAMRDIYGALISGASLFPFDLTQFSFGDLATAIIQREVTIYNSVASVYRRFLHALPVDTYFDQIRLVRLGGEASFRSDLEMLDNFFSKDCQFFAGYGTSETGTICQHYVDRSSDSPIVKVGFPAPGMKVLILDREGKELASGSEGEVAVSSAYLADGYWNDPERTEKNFYPDPRIEGNTIYLTGDIGYIEEDGCLVISGRKDRQLKIRGAKVDLSRLEALLNNFPHITGCVVNTYKNKLGDYSLVAFVEHRGMPAPAISDLRASLAEKVPAQMIPSRFVFCNELPLTRNGKLNRSALQHPENSELDHEIMGSNLFEHQLLGMFQDALELKQVGLDESFFDLGGDSLAAASICTNIRNTFDVNLPLMAIREHQSVQALAANILRYQNLQWPALTLLRRGTGTPMFLIPGAGSDSFSLLPLANALQFGGPIWGLQPKGGDGVLRPCRDMEETITYYSDLIENVAPAGPLLLAGTSYGGLVAIALARHLIDAGKQVLLLGIIDTRGIGYPQRKKRLPVRKWLLSNLRFFFPLGNQDEYTRENVHNGIGQLKDRLVAQLLYSLGLRKRMSHRYRFMHLLTTNVRVRRSFRPRRYKGPVVLFRTASRVREDIFLRDDLLGWGQWIDDLTVEDIPGLHGEHIMLPHVKVLAEKFDACIGKVISDHERVPELIEAVDHSV